MKYLSQMNTEELHEIQRENETEYKHFQSMNLKLDMTRGKPSREQLKLSLPMLDILKSDSNLFSEDGTDCRNYGNLGGIAEARKLMSYILNDKPENVIIGGNSSLSLIYNTFVRFLDFGPVGGDPWDKFDKLSWICPVPGYDRHFSICKKFGFNMIPVPLTSTGPDMDKIEQITAEDETIKGIFCIPMYSNPSGITYSDETVRRLARLNAAAPDFTIIWDMAYTVHHLYSNKEMQDNLLDISQACAEAGKPNRCIKYASTSKITFAGAGITALSASPDVIKATLKTTSIEMIGRDKLNQLRHARFLPTEKRLSKHMELHADILRPKFELVEEKLTEQLTCQGIGSFVKPKGGYFVLFNTPQNCAKRSVELAANAGLKLTPAGSTWPSGYDPADSDIRIAPSFPPLEELNQAMDLFCCCVKLAYIEQLLHK